MYTFLKLMALSKSNTPGVSSNFCSHQLLLKYTISHNTIFYTIRRATFKEYSTGNEYLITRNYFLSKLKLSQSEVH